MRIENIKDDENNNAVRISAQVFWEDSGQKNREIFFKTLPAYSKYLTCNPNAFLVSCILPAMYFKEKRIKVDGPICNELKNGLITNMKWFRFWYGNNYNLVDIESTKNSSLSFECSKRTSSLFLSGGVDSLFTLRKNRLDFPLDHPASIRDCFVVYGFDMGDDESVDELDHFEFTLNFLKKITDDAKSSLIPIYTNIRHLNSDVAFWMHWFFGAALSAAGHAVAAKVHRAIISSAGGVREETGPWGARSDIVSNYSSSDLQMKYSNLYERFDKVKVIADWQAALENIRVCTSNVKTSLNCGKCEKCIRTMIELLAIGKLKYTNAFSSIRDVTPEMLRSVRIVNDRNIHLLNYYKEVLSLLEHEGRQDLSRLIKKEMNFLGCVKSFDRKYLNRTIGKMYSFGKNILNLH